MEIVGENARLDNNIAEGGVADDVMLPCSLMVSDWPGMIFSCLRHCFQLGRYCDLTIKFSNGDSIKVHRVVLESCCCLERVGRQCSEDPGVVVAHSHVSADALCPLIRFLYTGVITLTAAQLHLARVIQLTQLLDCVRKLGFSDTTSYEPGYGETQPEETPNRPLAEQNNIALRCNDAAAHTEDLLQSNSLSINRDNLDENIFTADSVHNRAVSSTKSFENLEPDVQESSGAGSSIATDCGNKNQESTKIYADSTGPADVGASVSTLVYTRDGGNALSNGIIDSEIGKFRFHDHSENTPNDTHFCDAPNSTSNDISFMNSSRVTVSEIPTPILSQSQNQNEFRRDLTPLLNGVSFQSSSQFDPKTPASPSLAITSSVSSTLGNSCTPVDIFTNVPASSSSMTSSSCALASSSNKRKVQSSCDSAFDALLLGEPLKPSAADCYSSSAATSTAGNDRSAMEGSLSNILLLPTNSQMLEKANAAARRRRRSEANNISGPTRFSLDGAEFTGVSQSFFGATFQDEDSPYLTNSLPQNSGIFDPSPKISPVGALTNNFGKCDSSITNISKNGTSLASNSKSVGSHDKRSISSPYKEVLDVSEESDTSLETALSATSEGSPLDDQRVSSTPSASNGRIRSSKNSLVNSTAPKKKAKLDCAEDNMTTETRKDSTEDNNLNSSRGIEQETRDLSTASVKMSGGKQPLSEASKTQGFQFPRSATKNSLNCYEIKSRDDLSFEVVPSSVALKGNSQASFQSQINENELNSHAKIITEVLKKFPNLIKDKKNVKLKIMKQAMDKNSSGNESQESSSSKSVISSQNSKSASSVTFRCSKCHQFFSSHFSLKKHILNSHEEPTDILRRSENRLHACWRCSGQPQCFDSNIQLQNHLKEVHRSRQLQCSECDFKSTKIVDLAFHMFKEHGTTPPQDCHFPKCKACNFVAQNADDLERHSASSHSTNSFVCRSCGVSFRSQAALHGHVQAKVCQNKPGASFMCPHCLQTFSKSYNLKAHLRSRHKDFKFKRVESMPVDRAYEKVSFINPSESQTDSNTNDRTATHEQAGAVPNYLLSFSSKISLDASDDFQADNTCASSSFVVSNDCLNSSETYGVVHSNSGYIKIVSSCADAGLPYASTQLSQSTILEVVPTPSGGDGLPCAESGNTAWVCLPPDPQVHCQTSVPSSVMRNPFSQ